MHRFLRHGFFILAHWGGLGLLILSFVDSTPLYVPLGNDLLMVVVTARDHKLLFYYALMAAVGSVLGCLTVDFPGRKGGEKGFEKAVSPKRFASIKKRAQKNAAWALAVASLMPPPFPYTAVVAGTAAFQYPRKRLLTVIFFSRFARFSIVGALAILFSRDILRLARSRVVDYIVIALVVISVAGSAFVVWRWIKPSHGARRKQAA
jgi:membrane protein DedA with SNARE-associated domain